MVGKAGIYFATRKTASAHVYITKGKGKVRVNNVPIDMIAVSYSHLTLPTICSV